PPARLERAAEADEGQGAACPYWSAIRGETGRSGTGLVDLADAQPTEVDVLRAVPAEGGDRTAPGDRHPGGARAARARIASKRSVVRHVVDLRPGDAVGAGVQPQLHPHLGLRR